MAEIVPDLTQFDQKLALFGPFLDEFSGIQYQVEALQHFFSSLLEVAHFSMENPAHFCVEINNPLASIPLDGKT